MGRKPPRGDTVPLSLIFLKGDEIRQQQPQEFDDDDDDDDVIEKQRTVIERQI